MVEVAIPKNTLTAKMLEEAYEALSNPPSVPPTVIEEAMVKLAIVGVTNGTQLHEALEQLLETVQLRKDAKDRYPLELHHRDAGNQCHHRAVLKVAVGRGR